MTRSRLAAFACIVLSLSCTDRPRSADPTAPANVAQPRRDALPATCLTPDQLKVLAHGLWANTNRPAFDAVVAGIDQITAAVAGGHTPEAKKAAFDLVQFMLVTSGFTSLTGITGDLKSLVTGVFCIAGISLADPTNSLVATPSTAPQTLVTGGGQSGVVLPPGAITEPTLITVVPIPGSFPPGGGPLNTKLDQYPGFYEFQSQSPTNQPLAQPVVVAVCPAASVPADVRARLRLGHQAVAGFEITPPADASFLQCSASISSNSRLPGWVQTLASIVLPRPLYATVPQFIAGGVGGTAGEFSPFAPIDPVLSVVGGVGGTAGEFIRVPAPTDGAPTTGTNKPAPKTRTPPSARNSARARPEQGVTAGSGPQFEVFSPCPVVAAQFSTALDPACRPGIALKTKNGTLMQNVPVSWSVTLGGGTIASSASGTLTCGGFGSSANNTTDVNGKAGVCWTMGPTPGANTVIATPGLGGDAVSGVTFSPATVTYNATALAITPTAGAVGGNFTFDALVHAGSGSCSNSLTPVLTYTGGSAPVNAGSYTLTVTCGAGNPLYTAASATTAIVIGQATPLVSVSCPATVLYSGAAQTPCTASVTAPALSLTPTPVYAANTNVGTASASVTYAGGGNYAGGSASGSFAITKRSATATAGSATIAYGAPVPTIPCAVIGLLAVDAGSITCITSVPAVTSFGTYVTTPIITPTNPANYAVASVTGTLTVTGYVKSNCFAPPLISSMPPTKSYQKKGSVVPLKCTLQDGAGQPVTNASGNVLVQDMGTNGLGAPLTAFSKSNAFRAGDHGVYSYNLDTSPSGFVRGHFFRVTATWSDGSTTVGWFFLRGDDD